MRALIVTDIHANAAALRAVLDTPEARHCDRVYSLGDQINFGPQPRQVMDMLRRADAVCLLGNHEERLLHADDPAFAGYNWAMLHWTRTQTEGRSFELPAEVRLGPVLLTHAVPGDPWRLIHEADVPQMLEQLPTDIRCIISGHNHSCWRVVRNGREAVNPGSLGMLEVQGVSGQAPFATLELCGGEAEVCVHRVPYEPLDTLRAMLENGCAAAAPEFMRASAEVLLTGTPMHITALIRHVMATAEPLGLTVGDREAWRLAEPSFAWALPGSTVEFWKRMERDLLG